jgi:adenylate cyclase
MTTRHSLLQSYRAGTILQLSLIFLLALVLQSLLIGGMTFHSLLILLLLSSLLGPAVGSMELYVYPVLDRKYSFPVLLLIKTTANLVIVLLAVMLVTYGFFPEVLSRNPGLRQRFDLNADVRGAPFIFANWHLYGRIVLHTLVICFQVTFIYQMIQKMGRRVFWNFVTGKYHQPREEDRVFMFVDLKDSTAIAEQLGHYRFSRLLSDFFADLSEPVLETRGEIYQYVGDEVVVTWLTRDGLREANCVACFFGMERQVDRRRVYYWRTYGLVPEFKAGLHCGPVVTTQVGDLKSEVVYHGDVLNTAARILEQCNRLGQKLLLSESLASSLVLPGAGRLRFVDQVPLKGKEQRVKLYSVEKRHLAVDRKAG